MWYRALFSHSVSYQRIAKKEKGEPVAAAEAKKTETATGTVGSLVSPDSLFTFSGASFGIWIIWSVIERIADLPHNLLLGGAISLIAGGFLLWCDLTDPDRAPKPRTQIRIAVGIVNTFILFNAASGAFTLAGQPTKAGPAPSAPAATAPTLPLSPQK